MLTIRLIVGMFSIGLTVVGADLASGQNYPNKPIRIIVGAIGSGNNFQARLVAQGISGPLGQSVIVDNRGGNLPSEIVSKAPPDGYTLLVEGGDLWMLPLLQKMSYDALRDFVPISMMSREASIVVVHPQLPVNSVKELIALAKSKPGELNYGAGSVGSGSHLAGELFKSMAGVNIVRIGYKGAGPALTALIGGEVQMMFSSTGSAMPHVKSGRVRGLAVASSQPSALAPGLPTIAASGLPGYEVASISGVFAPTKTPRPIIDRLNREVVLVLNQSDVKQKFFEAGVETVGSSPEEFAATIKADLATRGKVIKDAGIRID